ncbi:MAG: DsbA family protein [Alicyclobacillus sp.]|nr:DsbA family protein [Alicyclobacillus sp.]
MKKVDMGAWLFWGTLTVVVVSFFGFLAWDNHRRQLRTSNVQGWVARFNYTGRPMLGNPNAPVTVVEFSDFKCTLCKKWHDRYFQLFYKDFIRSGRAKLYVFPCATIGRDSYTAAEAAFSLYRNNPKAFWKFYNLMYQYQQREDESWVTQRFVLSLIRQHISRVDIHKLRSDLLHDTFQKEIQDDMVQGLKAGVMQTPTFFVNGHMIANPFDFNEMRSMIQVKNSG